MLVQNDAGAPIGLTVKPAPRVSPSASTAARWPGSPLSIAAIVGLDRPAASAIFACEMPRAIRSSLNLVPMSVPRGRLRPWISHFNGTRRLSNGRRSPVPASARITARRGMSASSASCCWVVFAACLAALRASPRRLIGISFFTKEARQNRANVRVSLHPSLGPRNI
jgi:hypothetical protein